MLRIAIWDDEEKARIKIQTKIYIIPQEEKNFVSTMYGNLCKWIYTQIESLNYYSKKELNI